VLTWADAGALLAVLVWGGNFPVMKFLMRDMDPLPLALVRGALSTVLLVGAGAATGRWRWPGRDDLRAMATVSLLGYTLNQVLYCYGLRLTTASHSGLIFTVTPLFVFALSHWLGYVRMDRLDVVGLGVGVGGALLILGVPAFGGAGEAGGASLLGDLLTVGAAVTWGVWTILAAPVLHRYGTFLGTTWTTGLGTLGLVPFALPALMTAETRVSWALVGGIFYAAALAGSLGGFLWYAAVRRLGAARTAVYANMESFFAVLAATLFLGERVEGLALLGGAAIVAGVLLTRRVGQPREGH
jgi:drug/metabolite transporter (DMT)-like permease